MTDTEAQANAPNEGTGTDAAQLGQEMRQDASEALALGCLVRLAAAGRA